MGASLTTRVPAADLSANIKLDSWKSIAAYLGRDPRTVQLWEKAEGLPIHRLNHTSRPSVYAYTIEIDAWVRERSVTRRQPVEVRALRKPVVPVIQLTFARLIWLLFAAVLGAAILAAVLVAVRSHAG